MKFGEWTLTANELPPEPTTIGGDSYLATVINNQVVAVRYVKREVRGKEILKWEWNERACWNIIAWMPYPEPYKED